MIIEGKYNGKDKNIAIIISRFNDFITNKLLSACIDCLERHNTDKKQITVIKVPGAFEIPLIAQQAANSKSYDAIICLGAVIRGATSHYDLVTAEVSKGIAQVSLKFNLPVIFGVITTDTIEQAIERAGTKAGNKGWDSAMVALEMANLHEKLLNR